MELHALEQASTHCSLSSDDVAAQIARVDGLRPWVHHIVRGGGELTIAFRAEVDVAAVERFVQLEQECGGALFDITLSAEPTPAVRYRTKRVDMFPVLADLARYFDVQAVATVG